MKRIDEIAKPHPCQSNMKVALYARVSSERQDIDLSISAQLRALRDYASRNGQIVVKEYIDETERGRID